MSNCLSQFKAKDGNQHKIQHQLLTNKNNPFNDLPVQQDLIFVLFHH